MNKLIVAILISSLVGCAGANYIPVIDSRGVNQQQYYTDLAECQRFATQRASAGEQAAVGAAVGAGIGLLFAILLKDRRAQGQYMAAGALGGASGGAVRGETDQRTIIKTCMQNRGYSVLN